MDKYIGKIFYNTYTNAKYVAVQLPNIIEQNVTHYCLVRIDGCGYYLLRDSVDKFNEDVSFEIDILGELHLIDEVNGEMNE